MDKKTKLIAVCAAGAVAILIGAGIARCALAPEETETATPAVEEASEEAAEGVSESPVQVDEGLSSYVGTTWESEDRSAVLTLSDSTIVEQGEAGVQVMYYEVLSEEPVDDGLSVQISFTRSAGEASTQTLLSISDTGDQTQLFCDAFALSTSYLAAESIASDLELAAHSSELNELLGADDVEIASVLAQRASAVSPTATLAAWDGEVYIDCNEDVLMTSFRLNDAASTIVQLALDRATGELSAL